MTQKDSKRFGYLRKRLFLLHMSLIAGSRHLRKRLCDSVYSVSFNNDECVIPCKDESLLFYTQRKGNLYKTRLRDLTDQKVSCLLSVKENHWLWQKKLDHAS